MLRLIKTITRREAARAEKLEHEAELRRQELAAKRRELEEETERRSRELEDAMELQRARDRLESLQTEVNVRKREEMRQILGSDYDSDEEREDVTKPKSRGYQPMDEQTDCMKNILEAITKHQADSTGEGDGQSFAVASRQEQVCASVPLNTPARFSRLHHKTQTYEFESDRRIESQLQRNPDEIIMKSRPRTEIPVSGEARADAALFGQALRENRLPKPKILTFDGDAKRYKIFMASFLTNVDRMLDEDDDQMKLTLLLQHCEGDALDQIEDCVMMPADRGYAEALQRLETTFGKNHLIARSYISGVTSGGPIKLNDVDAIVRLSNDMRKCRNVLSQLEFTSDLDASGTLESIISRLPDNIQIQWVRKASKILDSGRSATFKDLSLFIEERAKEYSCQFGQSYAERKNAASTTAKPHTSNVQKSNQKKEKYHNTCHEYKLRRFVNGGTEQERRKHDCVFNKQLM